MDDKRTTAETLVQGTLATYFDKVARALKLLPLDVLDRVIATLEEARLCRRVVFTCGNGGSAATAMHLASDLAKGASVPGKPDLKTLCLSDNISLLTAFANDEAYDQVFARRLAPWVAEGDVLVAISASGNSPNILNAVALASTAGATTIGFTGCDGGRLAGMVDLCARVSCDSMERVEDVHLLLCHAVTACLRILPDSGRAVAASHLLSADMAQRRAQMVPPGVSSPAGGDEEGRPDDGRGSRHGEVQR